MWDTDLSTMNRLPKWCVYHNAILSIQKRNVASVGVDVLNFRCSDPKTERLFLKKFNTARLYHFSTNF